MSDLVISGLLEIWQNLGFFALTALEVNFLINLGWVVFSSIFRSSSDYRLKQGEEGVRQLPVTFLSFRLISFLFSFLATLAIYITLAFWSAFYQVKMTNILWWLPSLISIVLAEASHFFASFVKEKEETVVTVGEGMLAQTTKELPIYFLTLFFLLGIFWLVMLVSNKTRFGF